jgi:hypothetical protein
MKAASATSCGKRKSPSNGKPMLVTVAVTPEGGAKAGAIRFEQEQLSRITGIQVQLQRAATVADVRNGQHAAGAGFGARRLRYQVGDVDRVAVVDTSDRVVGGIGGGERQHRDGAGAEGDRTGSLACPIR